MTAQERQEQRARQERQARLLDSAWRLEAIAHSSRVAGIERQAYLAEARELRAMADSLGRVAA